MRSSEDFEGLNPMPEVKHVAKWGTYQSDDGYLAVVPILEHQYHMAFSPCCGCGVRISYESGVPIFVHQEVRN